MMEMSSDERAAHDKLLTLRTEVDYRDCSSAPNAVQRLVNFLMKTGTDFANCGHSDGLGWFVEIHGSKTQMVWTEAFHGWEFLGKMLVEIDQQEIVNRVLPILRAKIRDLREERGVQIRIEFNDDTFQSGTFYFASEYVEFGLETLEEYDLPCLMDYLDELYPKEEPK